MSSGGGGTVTFAMNDSMSDNWYICDVALRSENAEVLVATAGSSRLALLSSCSRSRSAKGVGGVSTNSVGPATKKELFQIKKPVPRL